MFVKMQVKIEKMLAHHIDKIVPRRGREECYGYAPHPPSHKVASLLPRS